MVCMCVCVCVHIHKVSALITLLNTAYYGLRELTHCISSDLGLSFDSSSGAPISSVIYCLVPMCLFPVIAFQLFSWTLNVLTTMSLNVRLCLLSLCLSFSLLLFLIILEIQLWMIHWTAMNQIKSSIIKTRTCMEHEMPQMPQKRIK